MYLFLELLQISLGEKEQLSQIPSHHEWSALYEESERQAIVGVMMEGLERLPAEQRPPQAVLFQWIGTIQMIESRNKQLDERCLELQQKFFTDGFDSCILKGQGNALLYPNPLRRQCGDIDIWVRPPKGFSVNKTVNYLASKCGMNKLNVVYHHAEYPLWNDVEVEVHWRPSWRACPWYNGRMQKWILQEADIQFENVDTKTGLRVPTWKFNAVYQLQHMFLHVMQEGLGLRQIVDYFYLLKSEGRNRNVEIMSTLNALGLYEFAGAVMYVLREACGLDERYMICPIDERRGRFLLNEILQSGNFGHKDERNAILHKTAGIHRSLWQLKRKLRFLRDYPVEVLCGPCQIYHVIWRKLKLWKWE